jgi:hypothetical protein
VADLADSINVPWMVYWLRDSLLDSQGFSFMKLLGHILQNRRPKAELV